MNYLKKKKEANEKYREKIGDIFESNKWWSIKNKINHKINFFMFFYRFPSIRVRTSEWGYNHINKDYSYITLSSLNRGTSFRIKNKNFFEIIRERNKNREMKPIRIWKSRG